MTHEQMAESCPYSEEGIAAVAAVVEKIFAGPSPQYVEWLSGYLQQRHEVAARIGSLPLF